MQTRLSLIPSDHGRTLSWDEFSTADSKEGFRYELIHGRLAVSPLPNLPHDVFQEWLRDALRDYSRAHPEVLKNVRGPARVFLPEAKEGITAPEPDIACYAEFAEDPFSPDNDWRDYSPLLVAEVLSEDTADKDLTRNRQLYLQVPSIQEYWILDPRTGVAGLSLIVFRRRGTRWAPRRTIHAGASYSTPLLPGFSLTLNPHIK